MKQLLIYILTFFSATDLFAQQAKGNLFIIGGGERTPDLMQQLINTAHLSPTDHIAVLPMSSEEQDTAFYYFKIDIEPLCKNTIANLNFTKQNAHDKKMVDSLRNAKLIFITGGDQNRFMEIVTNTPVYDAIHFAYENGATVGGTSAGAALMSRYMITGNQLLDTTYYPTFYSIVKNNIELKEGLGLIDKIIVDQHFVARSRYNRVFSALSEHPDLTCAGIDESTALIVHGNKATVAGESQVVYFRNKGKISVAKNNVIKFEDVRIRIFAPGDSFKLK
ncbi:MAG: cyanophycinase [Fimbriimonadaceae bacterium]|nr:cyanophycinase [Chitinophagales bacterium]